MTNVKQYAGELRLIIRASSLIRHSSFVLRHSNFVRAKIIP